MQRSTSVGVNARVSVSPDVFALSRRAGGLVRGVAVTCSRQGQYDWEPCGRPLRRWVIGRDGTLVFDDSFESGDEFFVENITTERPPIKRSRGRLLRPEKEGTGAPPGVERWTVTCPKCESHHVLRTDRILPLFETAVRAGEVRSNGWVRVSAPG
jgi:hypothetical protein